MCSLPSVIPALGRDRHEKSDFEASLSYTAIPSCRIRQQTNEPVDKNYIPNLKTPSFFQNILYSWAWWYTPLILALKAEADGVMS